jgi:hydrogenase 3 maturation protease
MPQSDLLFRLRKAIRSDGAPPGGEARPVLVLGVGNELRSDDAAGVRVAEALARTPSPGVEALIAGPSPENSTAAVRQARPRHVVMVDAADMGRPPGTVALIDPADAGGGYPGTHGMSLGLVAAYLRAEIGCGVTLVGIQPRVVDLGEALSPEVAAAVGEVVLALRECGG